MVDQDRTQRKAQKNSMVMYYFEQELSICRADSQFEMITWKSLHSVSTGVQTWQNLNHEPVGFSILLRSRLS